jgi:hypothetical protein
MYPASKITPHGRSFLRRVFAVNLAWGVILYLLIDENQEANFWINLGSFAAMMLLARAGGWLRYCCGTGPWLVEGAAWHFGAVLSPGSSRGCVTCWSLHWGHRIFLMTQRCRDHVLVKDRIPVVPL